MSDKTLPPIYGVFLRPDPKTCLAVTTITAAVRQQFGIVSANAFPPHVTLAGITPILAPTDTVIEAIEPAVRAAEQFEVVNAGITRRNIAITYDVNNGHNGKTSGEMLGLAIMMNAALRPLAVPYEGLKVDPFSVGTFHAHISLASHELRYRVDLREEVEAFIHGLEYPVPASFNAEVVSLYQFTSEDWAGNWWETLKWEHHKSWKLPTPLRHDERRLSDGNMVPLGASSNQQEMH